MVKRTLIFFLGALSFAAGALWGQQAANVKVSVTATQAVISYTAPDNNPCTVQVSKSSTLSPLVHDVDPLLFSGSASDARPGNANIGTNRTFVVGARTTATGLDGRRYSRALQSFTQHYYAVTCDSNAVTGSFETANLPLGNLSSDVPPFDTDSFGNYGWPTVDWTNTDTEYVDPFTGILLKRVTFPAVNVVVDSNSAASNGVGVQDGNTFNVSNQTCAGSRWVNPCAALLQDSHYASYSGTGGDLLEISYTKDGYHAGGILPEQGGLANFQINVTGFGSDANAANRQISVCLSLHVFTGVCDTATVILTLPQSQVGTVSYPPTLAPDQFLSAWLDASHVIPLSELEASAKILNVSMSGNTLTWTGDTQGVGAWFDPAWRPGDHINVPGSAPACPLNECTIAAVTSAMTLNTVQTAPSSSGTAVATNFGAIVSKVTGVGSINIDSISNAQSTENGYNNYASGQSYFFSKNQVRVCVDRNGNAINPCRLAYGAHVPAFTSNAWELFFPDTGESRFIDAMRPPGQSGVDGYSNVFCSSTSAALDGANPMKSWCTGTSPDQTNAVLVSGTYQYNALSGCDYRHFSGYLAGENPCISWVNETPASTGNDITTKVRAIWPAYNPLYDGALNFCQMDEGGRFIAFKAIQGAGPASNGADRFGAVLIFDTVSKAFIQKFDSYSTYPARFGQLHAGCGESYAGYNSEDIATYSFVSGRGAAPYALIPTNIAGRSDLSLDPGIQIQAASITGGVLHLTTTPHQLGSSANTQIFIQTLRGDGKPMLYARVIDATHLALYYDAAFTQPVTNYANIAQVPYPAAGDPIWTAQTFFAQACPAGISAQWRALGVTAGAPNCITMTLAGEPVKQTNVDSQATNYEGSTPVLKVNVWNGGTGYSNPSCVISGGGGSGAACTATIAHGGVASVSVTSGGSGYSYPRAVFSQGILTATGSVTLSGTSIGSIQIDQPGLYIAAPGVTIWTGNGNGSGAQATATLSNAGSVNQLTVTGSGTGYFGPVGCAITGGGGSGATCVVAYLNGSAIGQVTLTNGGSGYTSTPAVVFTGSGSGAAASLTMAYPVASVTVTNGGSGYSMPVVSFTGGGSGAVAGVGLNEEVTYYPYPHNAATCGGDGTTARCWSQPLTLQEGDAFGFGNPPQNPYAEQNIDEKPFAVKVTRNGDGTITAVFARFLGGCTQTEPVSTYLTEYQHTANPILPQMNPSGTCWALLLSYAQTDAALSNPLPDPYTTTHGDYMTPSLSGALPSRVQNNQSLQLFRFGRPPGTIGQPYTFTSAPPGTFSGSTAQFTSLVQTHPSTRQWESPTTNELRWYLDSRIASNSNGSVIQMFQENSIQVGPCSGTTCIYDVANPYNFDPKNVPLAAWAGRYLLQDVSGPGSLLSTGSPWKYCFAYNAGECVSGAPQGHLYMAVDKATAGVGQWCGTSYFVSTPCAIPANPEFPNDVQAGMDVADSIGVNWRALGHMWRAWNGNLDGFTNVRATPDGSWAFTPRPWVNGVHCDWFAMKLPPWPGLDGTPRSGFVPISVTLPAAAGSASTRIRFGYAENGPPTSFFCTTRQEACTTSGSPFAYASENQTNTPCAAGCTVTIPAIAGRVVYYEVDRLDGFGNLVAAGPLQTRAVR
jgi:hypothetical protein